MADFNEDYAWITTCTVCILVVIVVLAGMAGTICVAAACTRACGRKHCQEQPGNDGGSEVDEVLWEDISLATAPQNSSKPKRCGKWVFAMLLAVQSALLAYVVVGICMLEAGTLGMPAVAVVGPVGVGKSTLCNVVASCIAGEYQLPCAAGTGSKSFTDVNTDVIFANWRFRDTRGDMFDVRP